MPISKDPEKRKKQLANLQKNMARKGDVKNPKGRPRKTISMYVEEFEKMGLVVPSKDEIAKMYLYIASMQQAELQALMTDPEKPMIMRSIARSVLSKKSIDMVETIVNRVYGKEQRLDITTNGKDIKNEPLTIRFVASKEDLEKMQSEVPDIPAETGKEG